MKIEDQNYLYRPGDWAQESRYGVCQVVYLTPDTQIHQGSETLADFCMITGAWSPFVWGCWDSSGDIYGLAYDSVRPLLTRG